MGHLSINQSRSLFGRHADFRAHEQRPSFRHCLKHLTDRVTHPVPCAYPPPESAVIHLRPTFNSGRTAPDVVRIKLAGTADVAAGLWSEQPEVASDATNHLARYQILGAPHRPRIDPEPASKAPPTMYDEALYVGPHSWN